MAAFTADPKHFTVAGAYYPTDHVFAMFADAAAAQAAAGAGATDAGPGASASSGPAADDDNVVDAEVKEVKKG